MKDIEIFFERKYPCKIISGSRILAKIKTNLIPLLVEPRVVILTNPLLKKLYGDQLITDLTEQGIMVHTIVVEDGEKEKCLTTAKRIFNKLVRWKIDRSTTLITLGGGVIGDLGGFVASIFMRGIPLIHIPTTLLAQIDSSIGGKVAINHEKAKNIIGSFYQPVAILTDFEVLQSLPVRQLKNGLVEAIKIAIISSPSFFNWLKENMEKILQKNRTALQILAERAIQEKIKIVLTDPWERNERKHLNLGHTIGHVFETIDGYCGITHGEAVALGILIETRIALNKQICNEELHRDIRHLFSFISDSFSSEPFLSLPFLDQLGKYAVKERGLDFEKFWKILLLDKKNEKGEVVFALPEMLGKVTLVHSVSKDEVYKSLHDFIAENKKELKLC